MNLRTSQLLLHNPNPVQSIPFSMKSTSNRQFNPIRGDISLGGLLAIVVAAVFLVCILLIPKVRTVSGNEVGVLESWSGVSPDPLPPGTYFYAFGIGKEVYPYTTSGQVFVMNDKTDAEEPMAHGRRFDILEVNSLDNQKMYFHVTLTWHIDPAHVVQLHKNYRDNIEERLIRPEVVNEVGIRATLQNAIDLYSGPKLNELRDVVTTELRNPTGKLAQSGIIVDRFIVEKPRLAPDYEKVIEQRQLAIATESQAKEQTKANEALAEAARASALKQQYETIVAADTTAKQTVIAQQAESDKATIATKADALNTVTKQEAAAKVVVINAKAEADRQIAISEAAKQAEINRAVGINAVGEAQANANKLLLSSYSVPGSDLYTRIQVAQSLATSFAGVKGYLPQGVTYNTVASSFDQGVSLLVAPSTPAVAPTSSSIQFGK